MSDIHSRSIKGVGPSPMSTRSGLIIDPAIDEKWRVWLARANSGEERDLRNAQRFLLIHAFGDEVAFNLDAEFHARVTLAENMLQVLAERSA